jgi:hypothetical protein
LDLKQTLAITLDDERSSRIVRIPRKKYHVLSGWNRRTIVARQLDGTTF